MSTIAAAHHFGSTRTAVRRPARPVFAGSASVRLTPRGRILFLVAVVGVVFAALTAFGGQSAATGEGGAPAPTRIVQIGEGDTLWGIATTIADPGQVREMIHQIEELNALSGAGLVEGQEIAIPVG